MVVSNTSSVSILVNETTANRYHVYVDKNLVSTLAIGPVPDGVARHTLISGLSPSASYSLSISKISEAQYNGRNESYSATAVHGFVLDSGGSLGPVPERRDGSSRRLEFIGDSLTAGYGAARFQPCRGSVLVEDGDAAWARQLCTAFGAACHVEAWSGRGLVLNYAAEEPGTHMPTIWRRSLASVPVEDWAFDAWTPHAVVVNLGTNDFCCGRKSVPGFSRAYADLILNVTALYGPVPVLAAVGPVSDRYWNATVEAVGLARAAGANATMLDLTGLLTNPEADVGCDGHPSRLGQRKMALAALKPLAAATGWSDFSLPSPVPPFPGA